MYPKVDRCKEIDANADQQPSRAPSFFDDDNVIKVGATVSANADGTQRVSIITNTIRTERGQINYKIRYLNDNTEHTVTLKEVTPIEPEPADTPYNSKEVDTT